MQDLPQYPSILHALQSAATQSPLHTALSCEEQEITYQSLWASVLAFAAELEQRGNANGRIAIARSNSIETVVACLGVMAARSTAVMLNPFFQHSELVPLLAQAKVSCLLTEPLVQKKLKGVAKEVGIATVLDGPIAPSSGDVAPLPAPSLPSGESIALAIFTGGTTGRPKEVEHSHLALATSMRLHCTVWPLAFGKERFLSAAPLFHVWGLVYATFIPIYTRSTLHLIRKFQPEEVLRTVEEKAITVLGGGPAPVYFGLLSSPRLKDTNFASLKYSLTGGAPCPEPLRLGWEKHTGAPLLEGWGMSEGAPLCLTPVHAVRKPNSVGPAVPSTEIEVVDPEFGERLLGPGSVGELRVRGPQLMIGYRGNAEQNSRTLRNGWLYTGDLGTIDSDGYVSLLGPKDDMILVGGYNVHPRQVEECLLAEGSIAEVACVGSPHPKLGQTLVAFVVLAKEATTGTTDLLEYSQAHLVKYRRPTQFHLLESLPRTKAHKIDRLKLKQMALLCPLPSQEPQPRQFVRCSRPPV